METLLEKEPESIIFERLGLSYGRVTLAAGSWSDHGRPCSDHGRSWSMTMVDHKMTMN